MFLRQPKVNTEIRCDILMTNEKKDPQNIWKGEYFGLLAAGRQSNGLILELSNNPKTESIHVLNTVEIVNQFHVSLLRPLVTSTVDLKPIVYKMRRTFLDQVVADVNDFSKNKDIMWSIQNIDVSYIPHDMTMNNILNMEDEIRLQINHGQWIQTIMQRGLTPSPTEGLEIVRNYGKGVENYIFVFTALGADIKVQEFGGYLAPTNLEFRPTIIFDVRNGPILTEKIRKKLGFVTCSKIGGPIYKSYTFLETVQNLLAIFDTKVYYAAMLAYVLPAVVLGVLYHCLLKKRIKKEYWITWHPFTWGLRALIWQAGNRRFNSVRFGWTTFMVVPRLMVAVIISYVFRSHVFKAIGQNGRVIHPGNPIKAMYDSGVTLVTDNYRLASFVPQLVRQRADWQMINDMKQNGNIAFISWMDNIDKIADGIGWGCRNLWGPPKVGYVGTWDFYFLGGIYTYIWDGRNVGTRLDDCALG